MLFARRSLAGNFFWMLYRPALENPRCESCGVFGVISGLLVTRPEPQLADLGLECKRRAGSSMWMAKKRNAPLVHWALSAHAPQRLRVPM